MFHISKLLYCGSGIKYNCLSHEMITFGINSYTDCKITLIAKRSFTKVIVIYGHDYQSFRSVQSRTVSNRLSQWSH